MKGNLSKNLFREFFQSLSPQEKRYFIQSIANATGASERNVRLWVKGDVEPTSFRKQRIDELAVKMGYDPIYNTRFSGYSYNNGVAVGND